MRVRTVAGHDELHRDGRSLVLLAGQVHPVSELGTLLRRLAEHPVDVEDLARGLEDAFGTPEEETSLELTRRAVDALVAAGLLETLDP